MRLLLDTHALLWWLDGDLRMPVQARTRIAEEGQPVLVSAASAWEIATKVRIGKLPGAATVAEALPEILESQRFDELPIRLEHARLAGLLPGEHRDPFDRMLAAQAQLEDLVLVTNDPVFASFGIRRLWARAGSAPGRPTG